MGMRYTLVIVFFGLLFLTACSSANKNKESGSSEVTTEEYRGIEDSAMEVAPIDDSGEALADDTIVVPADENDAVNAADTTQTEPVRDNQNE